MREVIFLLLVSFIYDFYTDDCMFILHVLSHPDSRSDPIGGSEPSLGCETIY